MSGLIAGALKGVGEATAFIGKTNYVAQLEAEKAAVEEAKQLRIAEAKARYDRSNEAFKSDLRVGEEGYKSGLRMNEEAVKSEIDFKNKSQIESIKFENDAKLAQLRGAQDRMTKSTTPGMNEADRFELDARKQLDAALSKGDAKEVERLSTLLNKGKDQGADYMLGYSEDDQGNKKPFRFDRRKGEATDININAATNSSGSGQTGNGKDAPKKPWERQY